jgi:hypothetical protein
MQSGSNSGVRPRSRSAPAIMSRATVVALDPHGAWLDKGTRGACKYAPVKVARRQSADALASMRSVRARRIEICRALATLSFSRDGDILDKPPEVRNTWLTFLRSGPCIMPSRTVTGVPLIVISGGSAQLIAHELSASQGNLAYDPHIMYRNPIYLVVHRLDYDSYVRALRPMLGRYKNLRIIGWSGGAMAGFGAARAAALAFADNLPGAPARVVMLDQDVVRSDLPSGWADADGRFIQPEQILGLGIGYPERFSPSVLALAEKRWIGVGVGDPTDEQRAYLQQPSLDDLNSPAQQAVSIRRPFREPGSALFRDGYYPPYMVSGGEDMLMGQLLHSVQRQVSSIPSVKITKKNMANSSWTTEEIPTFPLGHNAYWMGLRVAVLGYLYELEKGLRISYGNKAMTIEQLMDQFVAEGHIGRGEVTNTSASIIERIILRNEKLQPSSTASTARIFQRARL